MLSLALSALEIGSTAAGKTVGDLEVAQVVYEAHAASGVVLSYDPGRYSDRNVEVIDLRP